MSYEHLLAGIFGGFTSTLVLHPLDLLKVRFAVSDGQSNVKKSYKNISNAFATIVKEEGYRGLYKGVTPNCLGAGTAWGIFNYMSAGACAGFLTTAITNPIWVVKTRLCLQYGSMPTTASTTGSENSIASAKNTIMKETSTLPESKRYTGTWDALKKVYKYEGVPGLYKGFVPGLLNVSHGAIQLAVYEEMKKIYLPNLSNDEKMSSFQYLFCAATSKLIAASVTYPYQVVRARLQDQYVNYDGVIDVVRKTWRYESYLGFYKGFSAYLLHVTPNICIVFFIYESVTQALKNEGIRGFYKGLKPSLLRVVPASAITFVVYEQTLNMANKK